MWVTLNLVPYSISITLFYFEVGNHRVFIVDFLYEVLLGNEFVPIVKPNIRRLISYQEIAVENYIMRGEELFERYKIVEKLKKLEAN